MGRYSKLSHGYYKRTFLTRTITTSNWTYSGAQHVRYHATVSIPATHDKRFKANSDWLLQICTQQSEDSTNETPETVFSQWVNPAYRHGYTWPVAKTNLQKPIPSGHDALLLQASTSNTNFLDECSTSWIHLLQFLNNIIQNARFTGKEQLHLFREHVFQIPFVTFLGSGRSQ